MTRKHKIILKIHTSESTHPFKDDIQILDEEKHEIHIDPNDAVRFINNSQQELWDKVDRNLDLYFAMKHMAA